MNKLLAVTDTVGELFVIYLGLLLLGAVAFMFIEGTTFIDAFYWAGVTTPTLGYGDVTAKTAAGKILSVLMVHMGVIVTALFTARVAMKLIVDEDTFSHDEQEEIKNTLKAIMQELHKNGTGNSTSDR